MHCGHLCLGLFVLVLLAILGPYFALNRETRTLDAPMREALGGTYVMLPGGVTHYELSGPADGEKVVLIHGGTIPFYAWDAQMPPLHDAGFRVLRMVRSRLFGTRHRGASKRLLSGIGR